MPNSFDTPPWTFNVAAKKATSVAVKRNRPVFLIPEIQHDGRMAWSLSFQSQEEKEAYEIQRQLELRALHPETFLDDTERRPSYGGIDYEAEPYPEPSLATGLSPPEWEDGSPDEVNNSMGDYLITYWANN